MKKLIFAMIYCAFASASVQAMRNSAQQSDEDKEKYKKICFEKFQELTNKQVPKVIVKLDLENVTKKLTTDERTKFNTVIAVDISYGHKFHPIKNIIVENASNDDTAHITEYLKFFPDAFVEEISNHHSKKIRTLINGKELDLKFKKIELEEFVQSQSEKPAPLKKSFSFNLFRHDKNKNGTHRF